MAEITTDKLADIIHKLPAYQATAYADLFAAGCYLHLQGEKPAGLKMCRTALNAIGDDQRVTYFNSLMSSIEGNEIKFAKGVRAHAEVNKLFSSHADH